VQNSSVRTYPNGPSRPRPSAYERRRRRLGPASSIPKVLAGSTGVTASSCPLPASVCPVRSARHSKGPARSGPRVDLDTSLQFVPNATWRDSWRRPTPCRASVVMDVKTGEILADASLANTNPNPASSERFGWGAGRVPGIEQTINNLAFTKRTGSSSRSYLLGGAAGRTDHSVERDHVPSSVVVAALLPRREQHPLEHLTATQVLALSSNLGTYEIGKRVGENGLLAHVERLGFATDERRLPGQSPGLLVNAADWYASDQVALPIGQSTPCRPYRSSTPTTPSRTAASSWNEMVRGYVYANGAVRATPSSAKRAAMSRTCRPRWSRCSSSRTVGHRHQRHHPRLQRGRQDRHRHDAYPEGQTPGRGYNASFVDSPPRTTGTVDDRVVERPETTISVARGRPIFQRSCPTRCTTQHPLERYVPEAAQGRRASISSDVT